VTDQEAQIPAAAKSGRPPFNGLAESCYAIRRTGIARRTMTVHPDNTPDMGHPLL
jgi:hypothetical protein